MHEESEQQEILDAIAATTYIDQYAEPSYRTGTMSKEDYRTALLDAVKKCRRAHHLHPAGNHARAAARHQAAYNTLTRRG